MTHDEAYYSWCTRVATDLPSLMRLLYALPTLNLVQRKALLTACRVQSFPHPGSRLLNRLRREWDSLVHLDSFHQPPFERLMSRMPITVSLLTLIAACDHIFESPVTSGFLSAVVRSAPIEDAEPFENSRIELLFKEVDASIHEYRPVKLDYNCIFSQDPADRSRPFAPNMDPCPVVAEEIYVAFTALRTRFANRILYPKISSKIVGRQVQEEFRKVAPESFKAEIYEEEQMNGGISTQILQKLEFWKGIRVDGPVEVRSAWKYNDLKPRVYYAQGGTTFHISKYVQPIFNQIADSLEVTHTKNRYFHPTAELTKEDDVIIYDYSSFTSTLDETKAFIEELSVFFRGVEVFLMGGKDGLVACDLGELLQAWNQTCNSYADFDLGRVASFDDEEPFVLQHTCGMLGVPGDIQSKTILHGIHAAFIAMSLHRARCIGDDAKIYKTLVSKIERVIFESQLRNLGRISLEKAEIFGYTDSDDYDLEAWHYAKRPIIRYMNRVIQYYMTTFPTLETLLGLSEPGRAILPDALLLNSRRSRFSNIWLRLLVVLSIEQNIQDKDRYFLYRYQREAFFSLGIIGYKAGLHREESGSFLVPPFLSADEFGMDPSVVIVSDFEYDEEVQVIMPGSYIEYPKGYIDEEFECGGNQLLTFMTNMGILERKIVYETITRELVGDREFGRRVLGMVDTLYKYKVVRPIPDWMYSLM